jgi:hypothetical protein
VPDPPVQAATCPAHQHTNTTHTVLQALALLPILVNKLFRSIDRGGSALFISLTVAVVLEPSTGDSFRKLVLRLLGAGVSAGIGMLLLYFGAHVHAACTASDWRRPHCCCHIRHSQAVYSAMACLCLSAIANALDFLSGRHNCETLNMHATLPACSRRRQRVYFQ